MVSALARQLIAKKSAKTAQQQIDKSADTLKGQKATKITAHAKNAFLAPLYLYQGRKVRRNTIRLPEPEGARCGCIDLYTNQDAAISSLPTSHLPSLNLMIIGDSAAAGVGSETQQQALSGHLLPALQQSQSIHNQFQVLNWCLQATTGHTSFDILRRLYVLAPPSSPIDVMIISVGVNDTTANTSAVKWQQQLADIITIAQRKFGVSQLIFCGLPPMAHMPALPAPLSHFIGAKAAQLDRVLQHVCRQNKDVHYMATDFAQIAANHAHEISEHSDASLDKAAIFASDGFHPSSITYRYWAEQLAELIGTLLDNSSHSSETI